MQADSQTSSDSRQLILNLLTKQELSAQQIAHQLGISPAAVRQHLAVLLSQGKVERRKVVTQPSRPTYFYRWSESGKRTSPKRYDLLAGELLQVLRERQGAAAVVGLLQAAAARLTQRMRQRWQDQDPAVQWRKLLDWLEEELAWQADAHPEPEGTRAIVIHRCPFQDLSREHPEVCGEFFSAILRGAYGDIPVQHAQQKDALTCCVLRVGPTDWLRAAPDAGPA